MFTHFNSEPTSELCDSFIAPVIDHLRSQGLSLVMNAFHPAGPEAPRLGPGLTWLSEPDVPQRLHLETTCCLKASGEPRGRRKKRLLVPKSPKNKQTPHPVSVAEVSEPILSMH